MADKYIIVGATYNGDGTTSSEAASAGAAGAWNHITVMTGTAVGYGTLAAGDTVYIRSKTSAGADITVVPNAYPQSLGVTTATAAANINWVLDGGTIWSGIDGTLSFASTNDYYMASRSFNNFRAEIPYRLRFSCSSASKSGPIFSALDNEVINAHFDTSANVSSNQSYVSMTSISNIDSNSRGKCVLRSCYIKLGRAIYIVSAAGAGRNMLIDCDIEIVNSAILPKLFYLVNTHLKVIGGRVFGSAVTTGMYIANMTSDGNGTNTLQTYGLKVPSAITQDVAGIIIGGGQEVQCSGLDNSGKGSLFAGYWGCADSRDDGYYPTLNATYPDTISTPWSWKLYPYKATHNFPGELLIEKIYTDTSAAKTVTLELLIADTLAANLSNMWMDVHYVDDSTGLQVMQTTRATGALTASSAAWSAETYGAVALSPYKLSLTTSGSIRQNTRLMVYLNLTIGAATSGDILFACPDVQLS